MHFQNVRPQEHKRARSTFFLNDGAPPTQDDEQVPQDETCDQGGAHEDQVLEEEEAPRVPPTQIRATIQRNHPVDQILGDISKGVTTRSRLANFCEHYSFVSSIEPFRVEEALLDPDWVLAMQKSSITSSEMKFGPWCHVQSKTLWEPSGCSATSKTSTEW
jgi:hypothetical protein